MRLLPLTCAFVALCAAVGPIGQELMFNFIQVQPYLSE